MVNLGVPNEIGDGLRKALVAASVSAFAVNVIVGAVVLYLSAEIELIKRLNQGNGVVLELPLLAPGIIIPTTRNPLVNTPSSTWATADEGVLIGAGGDEVTYTIQRGATGNPDVALFRLENRVPTGWPPGTVPWNEAFILRDGNGGEWVVEAVGRGDAENGLYTDQLDNGQTFSFRKPGVLGVWVTAFEISGIEGVKGGDRVTFTWVKDLP